LHRRLHWSALIPGLVVSGAIVAAATLVLIFGRVGAIHGKTVRFYVATNRARAVIPGTDVWLDGRPVGKVVWVHFQPPIVDTAVRMLIAVDLPGWIHSRIRRNTRVDITTGASFIGAPVISLDGGSVRTPELADGDTLRTPPQGELDGARASLADMSQSLPQVVENLRALHAQAMSSSGTIGALEGGQSTARRFIALTDDISRLSVRAKNRRGTLARFGREDIVAAAHRAIAAADSLQRAVSAQLAGAAWARDDSTVAHDIADARGELEAVESRLVSAPADSAGKGLGTGPGLARLRHRMTALDAQLGILLSDVIHRPLRYIAF